MSEALRVLLVEDNVGDAKLLREMLCKEGAGSFELTHRLRLSEAVTHLAKGGVDVLLLDLGLPDGQGLETVRRAHAVAPDVPVIVLTGLNDEALAAAAMTEGAQDYLIKGQIESRALPRALRHAVERYRMQRETDLLRTTQLQIKDEFLSHVSHELRSPLGAIYEFVTLLLDQLAGELQPKQREYLGIVLRNARQLGSMINDLLEVTGMQTGKLAIELQSASVSDAISYAMTSLQSTAESRGIRLGATGSHESLPPVCADPMRLRQILLILIDNALKFTPSTGAVMVGARLSQEHPGEVLLEVADTGCGVSPELSKRIFERLYQGADTAVAGRKGLGLGLYICKELVERQGGRVWVEAGSAGGATFCVTLPIFSLPDMVEAILRKAARQDSSLSFIVAEVNAASGWPDDVARGGYAQRIRELLARCLQSDLHSLLPKNRRAASAAELFFIAAIADQTARATILRRIRGKGGRSEYVRLAGLSVKTSHPMLDDTNADPVAGSVGFVARVSGRIHGLLAREFAAPEVPVAG